jgi:two-component system phosphate regulon response regulator PhoB
MGANGEVLVIDDEADLAQIVCHNLEREGFRGKYVLDGASGLAEVSRQRPDLVIVDRRLPGLSGDEVVRRLRTDPKTAQIPIVMISAKAEESDRLVGFALGVDDYVTKPFSMRVLLARVKALLCRTSVPVPKSDVLTTGSITVDRKRCDVHVSGKSVKLTSAEFAILSELMSAYGRVLSREQLSDRALGGRGEANSRSIDVHISALRRKLGRASAHVQTIRGVGYTVR